MINKVILVGYAGADAEVRATQNGQSVASFSVATSESWKDKEGNKQEKTEWHRVVVWGNLADIVGRYVVKGKLVYCEGKIQTRKWQDKEGQDRYTTEIVVHEVKFLGGGSKEEQGASSNRAPAPAPAARSGRAGDGAQPEGRRSAGGGWDPHGGADDDIPF